MILTKRTKGVYALGQLGWSILINIVNLQLVYFYIPTNESGIPEFLPQVTFLVVLNTLTLLAASGRLFDAITDPIIAYLSDNWKGKNGRRVPFLRMGAIPAAICCILLFIPISQSAGWVNMIWLFFIQLCFYLSLTLYVTPYFALLAELGSGASDRLSLSLWISITYALGIVIASQVPGLASVFSETDASTSIQLAIGILSLVAICFMLVPAFLLKETELVSQKSIQAQPSIIASIKETFKNAHFKYYVVADFAYFSGLTITMTGLLYYVTILLELEESSVGILLPLMVLISFFFYPVVSILARRFGKKRCVVLSFAWLAGVFGLIYMLGTLPIDPSIQALILVVSMAVPISFLGVLPNAILGDIASSHAMKTGVSNEGMFFAARTLLQKFGQTAGVIIFASLTILGKDIGDDLGIRMSGVVGAIMCAIAALYFSRYDEQTVLDDESI